MKSFLYCLLLSTTACLATVTPNFDIDIYGETKYSSDTTQSLDTNLYIEYNFPIYESAHKKWGLFVAGKVNPAYDHLGNELKVDVFTVLGIDF